MSNFLVYIYIIYFVYFPPGRAKSPKYDQRRIIRLDFYIKCQIQNNESVLFYFLLFIIKLWLTIYSLTS